MITIYTTSFGVTQRFVLTDEAEALRVEVAELKAENEMLDMIIWEQGQYE